MYQTRAFAKRKRLKIKICNFLDNKFKFPKKHLLESKNVESDGKVYYEQIDNPKLIINSDIKIKIKKDIKFFLWVNLWYSTWKTIKKLYDQKFSNNLPSKSVKNYNFNNYNKDRNSDDSSFGEENTTNNYLQNNSIKNSKHIYNNNDEEKSFEKIG